LPLERGSAIFVARDQEQEQVLGAVLAGRGAAIVGPAGVGKTALLSAVARRLSASRFGVVWTAATEASRKVPFSVFRGLAGISDRLDYSQAYGLLRTELTRRAAGRVPVLVIDDVHRLDNWSATLTLGLAGEGDVRLVVAAQSDLSTCDAVLALWKDGYLGRLDMVPLTLAGSAQLVRALVGAEAAGSTMDMLHRWTGGNPLFLTELVRHARDTRQLVVAGGLWWWRGALALPPRLVDLFDRRLRGLAPAYRDALAAVAMGEPLSLPMLDAVALGGPQCPVDRDLRHRAVHLGTQPRRHHGADRVQDHVENEHDREQHQSEHDAVQGLRRIRQRGHQPSGRQWQEGAAGHLRDDEQREHEGQPTGDPGQPADQRENSIVDFHSTVRLRQVESLRCRRLEVVAAPHAGRPPLPVRNRWSWAGTP
jgi:predicted ATPase